MPEAGLLALSRERARPPGPPDLERQREVIDVPREGDFDALVEGDPARLERLELGA